MNANTREKKTKKKLNAIDWFLIAAVVLCLIGAALRMLLGSESGSFTSPVVMEDYIVSYEIRVFTCWQAAWFLPSAFGISPAFAILV